MTERTTVRTPSRSLVAAAFARFTAIALSRSALAAEMIICSGVDTIDVGYRRFDDPAGHSYRADPRVVRDAAAAFSEISPADPARAACAARRAADVCHERR